MSKPKATVPDRRIASYKSQASAQTVTPGTGKYGYRSGMRTPMVEARAMSKAMVRRSPRGR